MSQKETKGLETHFVALYVEVPGEVELDVEGELSVWPLEFDGDRFRTGTEFVVEAPHWRIEEAGVYGTYYSKEIAINVTSGTIEIRRKHGIAVGKDPWPPPPPPPPPFAAIPRAASRWVVHTVAHHESCNGHPSELFLATLGG